MFATVKARGRLRGMGAWGHMPLSAAHRLIEDASSVECYRLSRSARIKILILILAIDLAAFGAGLEVFAHRVSLASPMMLATGTICASVLFGLVLYATRRIQTSRDMAALTRIASGVCAVILVLSAMLTRVLISPAIGQAVLVSLSTGCVIVVLGRVLALAWCVQRRNRWIEHVVVMGTAGTIARQHRSRMSDSAQFAYAGAILIGGGEVTLPVLFRIDDLIAATVVAAPPNSADDRLVDSRPQRRLFNRADRIVLLEDELADRERQSALRWLERFSHEVHVLRAAPAGGPKAEAIHRHGVVAKAATIQPAGLWLKRSLDVILSLAGLTILLPALLIVAVLIRLESKGPALFRQTRLGCDNLPFTVLKFRTMRHNGASDGSVQAVRGDTRVTRLGGFLRKSSIDELPQLLNVLGGSMSLVGPRPHPLALNCRFEPLVPRYAARHSVPPGITGWAQINGARGETPTIEAMQRRVDFDLEYVSRQSLLLDVSILFRTVGSVLRARNVY